MNISRFVAALLFVASPAGAASFSSSARGTATAQFLNLGVGARAVSMGEAYSAVADEASAMYWTPAGLSRIKKQSATFMHAAYIDSSFFDYGAYGQNLGEWGAWGIGLQYFNAGSVEQTDITGTDIGKVTPNDLAVSLGYAKTLKGEGWLNGFSVGLSGKYIKSKLVTTAQTGAVDAGVLSPAYFNDKLRLAFTMQNLGRKMKFEQESEDIPLVLKAGGAYKILDRWLAAVDVGLPKHDKPYVAVGTEYLFPIKDAWTLAGRLGFNSRTIGSVDGFTGISFGVGFAVRQLGIDYSFLPFGGVGQAHLISLSCKF